MSESRELALVRGLGDEVYDALMNALKTELQRRFEERQEPISLDISRDSPAAWAVSAVLTGALEGVARFAWPFTSKDLTAADAAQIVAIGMRQFYDAYTRAGQGAGERPEGMASWLGAPAEEEDPAPPSPLKTPPRSELN